MSEETKVVVPFNEEEIKQSLELSGQQGGNQIPFVPIFQINNRSTKEEVEIDGKMTKVTVPAVKGFNKLIKENDGWIETLIEGDLAGVILKERYQLEKKYKPKDSAVQYRSDEFDSWNEKLTLHDVKSRKNVVATGTYSELKEKFTSLDGDGKLKKDFALFCVLYLNHDLTGDVIRLKLKMTQDNDWFGYKKSLKQNEPWAGFLTHFNLLEKKHGEITYWHVDFSKGEQVPLTEQLELQKGLNEYFMATRAVHEKVVLPEEQEVIQVEDAFAPSPDDEIDVNQIPL